MKPHALLAGSFLLFLYENVDVPVWFPSAQCPPAAHPFTHSALFSGTSCGSSVASAFKGFRADVGSGAQCCNLLSVVWSAKAWEPLVSSSYHVTHVALQVWSFCEGYTSPLFPHCTSSPKVLELYSQARQELKCWLRLLVNHTLCVTLMKGTFVLKLNNYRMDNVSGPLQRTN